MRLIIQFQKPQIVQLHQRKVRRFEIKKGFFTEYTNMLESTRDLFNKILNLFFLNKNQRVYAIIILLKKFFFSFSR